MLRPIRTRLPFTRTLPRISRPMSSLRMATAQESALVLVRATTAGTEATTEDMVDITVATVRILVDTAVISEATMGVVITADIIEW